MPNALRHRARSFAPRAAAVLAVSTVFVSSSLRATNTEAPEPGAHQASDARSTRIVLVDSKDEACPALRVYYLSREGEVIETADVDDDGAFAAPADVMKKADAVVIGPHAERLADLDASTLVRYDGASFHRLIASNSPILIGPQRWRPWIPFFRCVHGTVDHCYPYPWIIADFMWRGAQIGDGAVDLGLQPIIPFYQCEPVCDGLVEVYRRTCCCPPILIQDPRIWEIIERIPLPDPPLPDPPGPRPDPVPWSEVPCLAHGALDVGALDANRDAHAIRSLGDADRAAYIQARTHLFCTCGGATKVGQGFLQQDGSFDICWSEPWRLLLRWCHDEYAFRVTQVINGQSVVIYDGVAANRWFDQGDPIALTSYHWATLGCDDDDIHGDGAFVLLEDIGATPSHLLETPDATGRDRVAAPGFNDGLVNPDVSSSSMTNCNWGGTLPLRYHFSDSMESIGARYYRVSVVAANTLGAPASAPLYLDGGVSWTKFFDADPGPGVDLQAESETLGPQTIGSSAYLYEIPYDEPMAEWKNGQFHAYLDTTRPEFGNGRYLLTLELFDASGNAIKPNAAPAGDPGAPRAFSFYRWENETGPMELVPYGALTHMFWWDNRAATANIEDLRVDGSANTDVCQFLDGSPGSQFSCGYRAYHPDARFLLNHTIVWGKGLSGMASTLVNSTANVGVPPAAPHQSASLSFADMLGDDAACSFWIRLRSNVKTWNGSSRLSGLDRTETAAFALSTGAP